METIRHSSLRSKMVKGGALLFTAKGVTQACTFLRNVIVARVIGVENYGIAVTFSVTIAILDMIGNLSVDKLIIQARDGDDIQLQSAAHTVQAIRGAASAVLIALFAWPFAKLFGVPQAAWAFRFLALIPLIRGLIHLDPQRVQRHLNYRPSVGLEIAQQVITTLLAWPLSIWLHDYSAMLWLLIIQFSIPTIGSFLVAQRSYRWSWQRIYISRFLDFGWPLVINGILLFGVFQGDRFLIGSAKELFGSSAYTLADLGIYSIALSLTLTPTLALSNISVSLILPLFSPLQDDRPELYGKIRLTSELFALLAGVFALCFILAGGWLVVSIYGSEYAAAGSVIGWLAAMQAVRMLRLIPTTAAMALADTRNAMVSNLFRSISFIFTIAIILHAGALKWIAFSGFCGEVVGLTVCLFKLKRDHQVPLSLGLRPAVLVLTYLFLTSSAEHLNLFSSFQVPVRQAMLGIAVFLALIYFSCPTLRQTISVRYLRHTRLVRNPD